MTPHGVRSGRVVLLSTYELGRQPFGLASPTAWLRAAGAEVTVQDLALDELDESAVRAADLIGLHVPMHTATRLAQRVLPAVKALNPSAHVCVFGLYASMNDEHLRSLGADSVIGGEFEQALVDAFRRTVAGHAGPHPTQVVMDRLSFLPPDRTDLPPLTRYGHLVLPSGEVRVAGSTEASRGCRHRCRHCPLVPVYDGRFRIVAPDVVLEDVRRQVSAGAEHITFGDPDFLNGPAHAVKVMKGLHAAHPDLTYDVTIKVEHLRRHRNLLPMLVDTGCILITTAVESFDEEVLAKLDKGHTAADLEAVLADLRNLGLALNPTFVAFHPWTTAGTYLRFVESIARLGLVEQVPPVQYAIRLLLPAGSKLLDLPEVAALVEPFDRDALCHPWRHPDPAIDQLHRGILGLVAETSANGTGRADVAAAVWNLARRVEDGGGCANAARSPFDGTVVSVPGPSMSEPWYCCAEPTEGQLTSLATTTNT